MLVLVSTHPHYQNDIKVNVLWLYTGVTTIKMFFKTVLSKMMTECGVEQSMVMMKMIDGDEINDV